MATARTPNVNPDLQKERDTATFNVNELTNILDGGVDKTRLRKTIETLLFTGENAELFSTKKLPFLTRSERYDNGVAKAVKLYTLKRDLGWTAVEFGLATKVINNDYSLGLHDGAFAPAVEGLSSDEQKAKWLPLVSSYQVLGNYAQTELGHGTNLQKLETTATFDPARDEFVINTPRLSSMKWWPGSMSKSSTHAMVMAHLVIGNKRHGLQAFIVPLRSLGDHRLLPGIELGDIGPKLAMNCVDNGYLIMKNVRVPRENMLMKHAKVSRDGTFTSLSTGKGNYGGMLLLRVKIITLCSLHLMRGACVAIRYSAVRRQTTLKPGTPEQQVLDFQTQQYKIFPCLAAAYAAFFTGNAMMASYRKAYTEIEKGDTSKLSQLHAQSSGLKAFMSEVTARELETARRACGGHGYLMSSGIADNMVTALSLVTAEGDATVLYLQTARYLLKQMARVLTGDKVGGILEYLSRDQHTYTCPIQTQEDCRSLACLSEIYRHRAHGVVLSVAQKFQTEMAAGQAQEVVFNNNMVAQVRAAKAHSHLAVVESAAEGLASLKAQCSPDLFTVLTDLCCFFAIHGIVTEAGTFLEMGALGLKEMEWLRNEELKLLAVLRPNAVALVDAFDLHDETVASVLGRYDGNVYQHLYESTQYEALNKTEVHPSYYKHLRGLIKTPSAAKL